MLFEGYPERQQKEVLADRSDFFCKAIVAEIDVLYQKFHLEGDFFPI